MDSRKRKSEIQIISSDSDDDAIISNAGGSGLAKRPYAVDSASSDVPSTDSDDDVLYVEDKSESESEEDSDTWDDCVIVPREDRANAVKGYFLVPTCMNESKPPEKPNDEINLSSTFKQSEFINEFQDKWDKGTAYISGSLELISDPFRMCVIDNFLGNTVPLKELRNEMYEIDWNERNMDLYEFYQSKNLIHSEAPYIKKLYEYLKTDVMPWIADLTSLNLNKISATCSLYTKTDYLLVHDDLQEDRAIAFVFYLTDPVPESDKELWTAEMGGALQLFAKDKNGHPTASTRNILPKNNRLIFFKVTSDSYHQVAEVLSMNHCRYSINGWFHSPNPNKYIAPTLEAPSKGLFSTEVFKPSPSDISLEKWVSSVYLQPITKRHIQEQMEGESEISLQKYFNDEPYAQLCDALKSKDIIWELVGPPNRRKYEVISHDSVPPIVSEFLSIFQSKQMFALIKDYTDLDLLDRDDMKPTLRYEFQRWSPGCYSLLSEYDWKSHNELDLIMYVGCPDKLPIVGGRTLYISTDESVEDALITLEPKDNTLNIVFRDTARIIKHNKEFDRIDWFRNQEYFYSLYIKINETL